jgi:hypothetical protein
MNAREFLHDLTDAELLAKVEEAKTDLSNAAEDEPNSEWHGSCFAGLLMLCQEASRRGLKLATTH